MADWEDDDFGGFESADIGDVGSVQAVAASPGPPSGTNTPAEGSSAQILDWILSNTPKTDGSPQLQQTPEGNTEISSPSLDTVNENSREPSLDSPASISHGEQLIDRLNDSAEIAKNLDDVFASSAGSKTNDSSSNKPNWSAAFSETEEKIRAVAAEEPTIVKTIDNEALHKLQAELDVALVMKEQTEKSMAELENELKDLTEKRKQDLEEISKRHEEDLEGLKSHHKEEMAELQNISEETVKLVTKQYSEIWKIFEREKAIEAESSAKSIVEKCLELLKQQKEMLLQKLEKNRAEQEKNLKEVLQDERVAMDEDIAKQLEDAKKNLEQELYAQLKENMSEEAKRLQELHTETLKEAMTKQQAHFEEVLGATLAKEREKFAETLKEAVKEAQATTEKAATERKKIEERRIRSHTMSVKMFLTSALEQLERQFPDQQQEGEES